MSYRKSLQQQLHLVFTEDSGFQFYFTLPKYLARHPALPRQLRWSLGRDEPLARQLCAYLNQSLKFLYEISDPLSPKKIEEIVKMMDLLHQTIRLQLQNAHKIWDVLPHPSTLSRSDLTVGRERLERLALDGPVLFRTSPGGELVITIHASAELRRLTRLDWYRMDWPLGTSDEQVATDAAIYILAAIDHLERLDPEQAVSARFKGAFSLMALYEYLHYARPDKGTGLDRLPASLPSRSQLSICT